MAKWRDRSWFKATVEAVNDDGTYRIKYCEDGVVTDRQPLSGIRIRTRRARDLVDLAFHVGKRRVNFRKALPDNTWSTSKRWRLCEEGIPKYIERLYRDDEHKEALIGLSKWKQRVNPSCWHGSDLLPFLEIQCEGNHWVVIRPDYVERCWIIEQIVTRAAPRQNSIKCETLYRSPQWPETCTAAECGWAGECDDKGKCPKCGKGTQMVVCIPGPTERWQQPDGCEFEDFGYASDRESEEHAATIRVSNLQTIFGRRQNSLLPNRRFSPGDKVTVNTRSGELISGVVERRTYDTRYVVKLLDRVLDVNHRRIQQETHMLGSLAPDYDYESDGMPGFISSKFVHAPQPQAPAQRPAEAVVAARPMKLSAKDRLRQGLPASALLAPRKTRRIRAFASSALPNTKNE